MSRSVKWLNAAGPQPVRAVGGPLCHVAPPAGRAVPALPLLRLLRLLRLLALRGALELPQTLRAPPRRLPPAALLVLRVRLARAEQVPQKTHLPILPSGRPPWRDVYRRYSTQAPVSSRTYSTPATFIDVSPSSSGRSEER